MLHIDELLWTAVQRVILMVKCETIQWHCHVFLSLSHIFVCISYFIADCLHLGWFEEQNFCNITKTSKIMSKPQKNIWCARKKRAENLNFMMIKDILMCQGFWEILFLHESMLVASFLFNFLLIFTFSFAVNLFMGESVLSVLGGRKGR